MGGVEEISLCMIVRDEEENIRECLESICEYIDELVVVDTGSRDRTPEIVREFGAKLITREWKHDFSEARNAGLREVVGDWVFWLDADEVVPRETAESLGGLVVEGVEAWKFNIYNRGRERVSRHSAVRMFRRREEYSFTGRVHEQIVTSIRSENPDAVIGDSGLAIEHKGYRGREGGNSSKTCRNISLLHKELKEKGEAPFVLYNLGVSYYVAGKMEAARKYFKRSLELGDRDDNFFPVLHRNYALCLAELGNFRQSFDILAEGLACFPDYADLYFARGQIYLELDFLAGAAESFLRCTHFHYVPSRYTTTLGVTGMLALENLGEIYFRMGKYSRARGCLERVLKNRMSAELLVRLYQILRQEGRTGIEAVDYLRKNRALNTLALDTEDMVSVLTACGDYSTCLEFTARQESNNTGKEIRISRAYSLLNEGEFELAEEMFRDLLEGEKHEPVGKGELYRYLCYSCWLQEPRVVISAPENFPLPEEKIAAVKIINSIIAGKEPEVGSEKVGREVVNLAGEILKLGDVDLALAAAGVAAENPYYLLGHQALRIGLPQQAERLLIRALYQGDPVSCLQQAGLAAEKQGKYARAAGFFRHTYLVCRSVSGESALPEMSAGGEDISQEKPENVRNTPDQGPGGIQRETPGANQGENPDENQREGPGGSECERYRLAARSCLLAELISLLREKELGVAGARNLLLALYSRKKKVDRKRGAIND